MSGHSKWATTKHKKAKTDAQKGKAFTKVVREIMMAARLGGADPDHNSRLRLAIQKAKEANMPRDNVSRAIAKGAGKDGDSAYEEIQFEAYGPHGVALLIETLTDNRNRTVPNLRMILGKEDGSIATKGAVSYLFSKKGLFLFEPGSPQDDIMAVVTEAGADEFDVQEDGSIEVLCEPSAFEVIKNALDQAKLTYVSASIDMIASTTVPLPKEHAEQILHLIEKLEDDDDVQNIYSNGDFSAA